MKPQKDVCVCVYIYIPGTRMTLVLIGKDLVLEGLTFKNRGQLGSIRSPKLT